MEVDFWALIVLIVIEFGFAYYVGWFTRRWWEKHKGEFMAARKKDEH